MATEKTDVVIVGLGAAGGILAAELGKAGLKVIGLERGPRLATADFSALDELRYFQRQDLRPNAKRQPVTWRPNAKARANPLPILNYGNQAGGGTVHYGAISWRFHEDDFRSRSQTIERYGASAIPKDCSLIDWPLTSADLEPFYDRAEYELGVSGKAGNVQGRKIEGGNPFEAPRRREYPLPPLMADQSGVIFAAGARKLGYHPFSSPRAILSQTYQGRPGCSYCGFCQAFGCHIGAKSSILVTKLPEADATGNFKLLTGAMCYRVKSDNSGRATGVSYWGSDGSDNTIEAELVILAPFIYDNTRLLLLSKTAKFPNGLANSSGVLGHYLMDHHFLVGARGRIDGLLDRYYQGNRPNGIYIPRFRNLGDDASRRDYVRGFGYQGGAGREGWGRGSSEAGLGVELKRRLQEPGGWSMGLTGFGECLPREDNYAALSDQTDEFGIPVLRIHCTWGDNELAMRTDMAASAAEMLQAAGVKDVRTYDARREEGLGAEPGLGIHEMGTARMGRDPRTSVLNAHNQAHDVPNLFVTDGACMASSSCVNPSITYMALTARTCDYAVGELKRGNL